MVGRFFSARTDHVGPHARIPRCGISGTDPVPRSGHPAEVSHLRDRGCPNSATVARRGRCPPSGTVAGRGQTPVARRGHPCGTSGTPTPFCATDGVRRKQGRPASLSKKKYRRSARIPTRQTEAAEFFQPGPPRWPRVFPDSQTDPVVGTKKRHGPRGGVCVIRAGQAQLSRGARGRCARHPHGVMAGGPSCRRIRCGTACMVATCAAPLRGRVSGPDPRTARHGHTSAGEWPADADEANRQSVGPHRGKHWCDPVAARGVQPSAAPVHPLRSC